MKTQSDITKDEILRVVGLYPQSTSFDIFQKGNFTTTWTLFRNHLSKLVTDGLLIESRLLIKIRNLKHTYSLSNLTKNDTTSKSKLYRSTLQQLFLKKEGWSANEVYIEINKVTTITKDHALTTLRRLVDYNHLLFKERGLTEDNKFIYYSTDVTLLKKELFTYLNEYQQLIYVPSFKYPRCRMLAAINALNKEFNTKIEIQYPSNHKYINAKSDIIIFKLN